MIVLFSAWLVVAPGPWSVLAEPNVGGHPQQARSIAMGGAARAIADSPDGLFVNPAGLAAKKHYVIDANGFCRATFVYAIIALYAREKDILCALDGFCLSLCCLCAAYRDKIRVMYCRNLI